MARSAKDIFSGGGGEDWVKIKDLVGDELELVDFRVKKGKFGPFPVIDAVTEDGDEIKVRGGEFLIEKLEEVRNEDLFPISVKVVQFDTDFGNPGYGFDVVE
jgi:ATP-dependent DNA ligase